MHRRTASAQGRHHGLETAKAIMGRLSTFVCVAVSPPVAILTLYSESSICSDRTRRLSMQHQTGYLATRGNEYPSPQAIFYLSFDMWYKSTEDQDV